MLQSDCAVNKAIKLCKKEENKINVSIQQWRNALHAMRSSHAVSLEDESPTDVNEDSAVLRDEEEVLLLERALEKALRVRGVSKVPRKSGTVSQICSNGKELSQKTSDYNMEKLLPFKSTSGGLKNSTMVVSVASGYNRQKARWHTATGRRAAARPGSAYRAQTAVQGKAKPVQSPSTTGLSIPVPTVPDHHHLNCVSLKSAPVVTCKLQNVHTLNETKKNITGKSTTGTPLMKRIGVQSPLLSVWKAQTARQNRLWDKVFPQLFSPVAKRTDFAERLLGLFPQGWPCSSPVNREVEVGWLTLQCKALTHCYQTEFRAARADRLPGKYWFGSYESKIMLEGLQKTVDNLLERTEKLQNESDAWDSLWSWSPDQCPLWRCWPWGDPYLPVCPGLMYSSEGELKELEVLRVRTLLLQQEIQLHQVLNDTVSPSLNFISSIREQSTSGVLRGLYSLLGKGGSQFPAMVVDVEHD